MKHNFPRAYAGENIGLFGGSFDPAHEGHAHVAETALKRLGLDRVWWLVSPQNPLKQKSGAFAERFASARTYARGRKMVVTDIETRIGARYTYQTLRALKRLYPGVRFTFLMGADSLAGFRRWEHWREIAATTQIAVVSRPGTGFAARALKLKYSRYFTARHHSESSTALRAKLIDQLRRRASG